MTLAPEELKAYQERFVEPLQNAKGAPPPEQKQPEPRMIQPR